jgi:NAD(P)-dependent dehydrogenase (short-subunit alcohol dehydrogenase family)
MYNKPVNETEINLLKIGGTPILAKTIMNFSKNESSSITATYRGGVRLYLERQGTWLHLELSEKSSIEKFPIELKDLKFNKAFFLIGPLTNTYFLDMSHEDLTVYYSTYFVNSLYLLQECLKNIKTTSIIIVMSSRAGSDASFNVHYSAAKSALETDVRRSARALAGNQRIIGISCGLVENSRIYLDMKPEHQESHKNRARGRLITVEELCSQIWEFSDEQTSENTGKVIHAGQVY